MPACIGEHQFGYAGERLGFPSLSACRAIVYQTSTGLFGYHNAGGNWSEDWAGRAEEFADYVTGHMSGKGAGINLYIAAFSRQPQTGYRTAADFRGEAKAFAKALGFKGPRMGYDLSNKFATGSAYVEFRRVGKNCLIFVNQWDDHHTTNAMPTSGLKADRPDHKMRPGRGKNPPFVRTDVDMTGLAIVQAASLR